MNHVKRKPADIFSFAETQHHLKHEVNRTLYNYYRGLLEVEGGIPARGQIDPIELSSILSNIVLFDVHRDGRVTFRLVGSDLRHRLGRDVVGMEYQILVQPERAESATRALTMVVDVPQGFRVDLFHRYPQGFSVPVEAVAFPLKSETKEYRGHVILCDGELERDDPRAVEVSATEIEFAAALKRDMIDLGFGYDDDFYDLVVDL
ncbi:MAG: PAS domain-containing protein [Alphaproteobacteria bacterium]|nr:PAS domain-containing protein [Alphaproteobacteria bacterium]